MCNVFLTFSYPSHLKHLLFRAFLEDCLPERLSKVGVLAERGIKKSKKHHAIAPISNNLCFYSVFGRFCLKCCVLQCFERIFAQQLLRRPSEAVDVWVSSGGALGGPGRALGGSLSLYIYIEKLPINRPSGRYVIYIYIYIGVRRNSARGNGGPHFPDKRNQYYIA